MQDYSEVNKRLSINNFVKFYHKYCEQYLKGKTDTYTIRAFIAWAHKVKVDDIFIAEPGESDEAQDYQTYLVRSTGDRYSTRDWMDEYCGA